jgi:hypothetical protein
MPTVIIHCCSMVSDPRRFEGAYSAVVAEQETAQRRQQRQLPVESGRRLFVQRPQNVPRLGMLRHLHSRDQAIAGPTASITAFKQT